MMTKAQDAAKQNYHYMAEAMRRLERALHGRLGASGLIPPEWQAIAQGGGQGGKVKITLWVEADVLAFFRSRGRGQTTRMADVLKAFMHARLAGVVKGPEAVDYTKPYQTGDEVAAGEKWVADRMAMVSAAIKAQRVKDGRE